LERPLFTPKHFQAQIGQKISLKSRFTVNQRQNYKGVLSEAGDKEIVLECEGEKFSFRYEDIDKAKVIPDIQIGAGGSRK
jgi:ribosome maturation factor RimP